MIVIFMKLTPASMGEVSEASEEYVEVFDLIHRIVEGGEIASILSRD